MTALDRTFGSRPLTLTPLPLGSIRPSAGCAASYASRLTG